MFRQQPLRVLHIDDDPQMTSLVAAMLGPRGIEVTQLNDPRQAIEYILGGNFRIVILDIDMPYIDGIELLRQIKQVDGGTSVVMLTGIVSLSNVLRSMRKGATACLFKPLLDAASLMECIEEVSRNTKRWWNTLSELSELRRQDLTSLDDDALGFSSQVGGCQS